MIVENKANLDFNANYWRDNLQYPDWYIRLEKDLKENIFPIVHDNVSLKKYRHKIYELTAELMDFGKIPLAESGANLDKERKPIDTIVIHHTEEYPNIALSKLSAIGLIRQYAMHYLENDMLGERVRGKAIWSGHFRGNKQVFFAYHWLIRLDGEAERLLEDKCVGWHSGNREINTKSIGIAFSGNYEHSSPPMDQIEAAALLIKNNYPQIQKDGIFGHREVKEGRTCPGDRFIGDWKEELLRLV